MTEQSESLSAEILKEIAPGPDQPPKVAGWRQVLSLVELPALAFLTAFALGAVLIALTDLKVLQEFGGALARMTAGGYLLIVLAVAVAAVAGWLFGASERVLARLARSPARWQNVAVKVVAGLGGLILFFVILSLAGFAGALDAAWAAVRTAYGAMAEGSIGNPGAMIGALFGGDAAARRQAFYPIFESLNAATPYIFAGLAVALGFRCGLFNIGAEGQLFIGAICSVYVGFAVKGLPSILHVPLALGAGALGGAAWAFVPAILKARVGAHEVINTIMMNYVAFRLSEWLLSDKGPLQRPGSANPVSPFIEKSAELPRFFADPIRFHLGFFIALAVAAFVYWFLFRTTMGFEIRTVGANPNAARYAGISITRNIVLAMCLSGALAGLAGANEVLGVNHNLANAFSSGYGFDSIALALLGNSHPIGVVLSALLFGTLRSGGTRMQNVAKIPVDIIAVVQALVIAFVAAPAIIRAIYRIRAERSAEAALTKGWGS